MAAELDWQLAEKVLSLTGRLTDKTLCSLWAWVQQTQPRLNVINVNQLTHVDSAGLAWIIYTINQASKQNITITLAGRNDKLNTLIALYNLDKVISS